MWDKRDDMIVYENDPFNAESPRAARSVEWVEHITLQAQPSDNDNGRPRSSRAVDERGAVLRSALVRSPH